MHQLLNLYVHAAHLPAALLYFTQAGTYGLAFRAARRGDHSVHHIYLVSALVHIALGLLVCSQFE